MKKAARFSIEILSLLLLMSHFLAGCSEEYGYNSEVAATESATPAPTIIDEDAAETVPSSGEELHMLTAQQGIAMTVGGETANGCYSLDPYPDASADIIYYDYLTQECIRLSADANLGHDPASTAYIPSFKGGARCFVVGDYLYVIKNGQPYTDASVSGNDPTARIYSMALDGSDRKIQEYGSNMVFNWFGGVAGNGTDALFTIVSIVDPQKAEVKSALVKFGRNLSGYEILYEWNDDVVANLVGTCDDSFIATITSKSDPTKTEWISYSFTIRSGLLETGLYCICNTVFSTLIDRNTLSFSRNTIRHRLSCRNSCYDIQRKCRFTLTGIALEHRQLPERYIEIP